VQPITTPQAPRPAGHYSQAMVHGGFVFVAGQLPLDPVTGELVGAGDAAAQTERVLASVDAILRAAGSGLDRVVSVTVYVTDRALWGAVNEVYERRFGEHRPARAVIPVPELRHGCLIELQAIAALAD
jgi:2-iminobutanoate/2-iminopropanoate deaminase